MDAVEKLHDNFLSCSICLERYKDPCTLPCGHTFCRICLGKFTNTRQDAIQAKSILCPFCKQMSAVPDPNKPAVEWPKQFKPHILMQGLLDTFELQQDTNEGTKRGCCSPVSKWERRPLQRHFAQNAMSCFVTDVPKCIQLCRAWVHT